MKEISRKEFKKLVKENCKDYKSTIKFATKCGNDNPKINFDMFQDLMDLISYYRVKEEIKD